MFYNEVKESLQKDIKLLLVRYTNEITSGNIGSALNTIKNVDIAMDQLKRITDIEKYPFYDNDRTIIKYPLHDSGRPISNDTYKNSWYDILKFFIETKQPQLIKLDYSTEEAPLKHRGTGKTSAIVRLASDFDIPIYTNRLYSSGLRDRKAEFELNATIVDDVSRLNMKQYNKGIILVDELTDISKIDTNHFTIIGFTQGFKE